MVRLLVDVNNISHVLEYYDRIKIYRSDTEGGAYVEITDVNTRLPLIPEQTKYYYDDAAGDSTKWYKTSYFKEPAGAESDQSAAIQGGTEVDKIGYTFGNYKPPPGEWGDIYTPDDLRYTMMWGIDSIGSDIAQSEWEDEQFRQIAREAVSEFESLLTMDIRRKSWVTRPADSLVQSRLWREGVDYTNEDEPYEFDPQLWTKYGFIQFRHFPIIKVTRAKWNSPVGGEIMDMIANDWLRVEKQLGQVHMFPQGGFSYGPYSVYGPLWTRNNGAKYPDAFEFDYETGYKNADLVPDGLRSVIAKYATIKCLSVIGDGLLAGFSSQSVSLDGLSESFSSTQSATSAYFGARIKQYSDEITSWLEKNRYKFAPIPISIIT